MGLLKYTNNIMAQVNNSPIIAGAAMLFLNIGSRYIDLGLSKAQEKAIKGSIAREALIFSIVFVATKNIVMSTTLTFAFFLLTEYIFNEKSKFCAAPNFFHELTYDMDLNGDNIISDYEVEKAIDVLKKAKGQKKY
jgi:hypothetical protein